MNDMLEIESITQLKYSVWEPDTIGVVQSSRMCNANLITKMEALSTLWPQTQDSL